MKISTQIIERDTRYLREYNLFPVVILQNWLNQNISTNEPPIEKLDLGVNLISELINHKKDNEWAFLYLLNEDIKRWKKQKNKYPKNVNVHALSEENNKIINFIGNFLNIDYSQRASEVYFVEEFPGRWMGSNWDAINIKPSLNTNIKSGIYFSSQMLSTYSNFYLCHEHVHIALEPNNRELHFVEWFDEGVCDFIGILYMAFINNNDEEFLSMILRKYRDTDNFQRIRGWNLRMIARLVYFFGMDFFKSFLNERIQNPKNIDWGLMYQNIISGQLNGSTSKRHKLDEQILYICQKIISMENPILLSATNYYLVKKFVNLFLKNRESSNFFSASWEQLTENSNISIEFAKKHAKKLTMFSVGSENEGFRAWDTEGIFASNLETHFFKASNID